MWNELRFAFRSLRRTPVFCIAAILTLGVGIGATAAMFSLFYQVLLRSLPVRAPERLAILHVDIRWLPGDVSSDNGETVFSYPTYERLRHQAPLMEGLAARSGASVVTSDPTTAVLTNAELVSGNFFQVMGVRAAWGRLLMPEDDNVRGGNPVAVLDYGYSVKHFGASANALNRTILLNGHRFLIVGVAPPSFHGLLSGQTPAVYVPLSMKSEVSPGWHGFDDPGTHWLNIVGRLKPGVSLERATAAIRPLWSAAFRDEVERIVRSRTARQRYLSVGIESRPAANGINQLELQWRKSLTVLMAMAGFLLLIACANVAGLLIARAVSRGREVALRMAIGAVRWQVIRHSLAESFVIAIAGGILGITLSFTFVRSLIAIIPEDVTGGWLQATPDVHVIAFSLLMVFATAVICGVLPAIRNSKLDPMPALKEQSSATSMSSKHTAWRQALVAGQLALSLALLVAAGLLAKTFVNLLSHDPGFRPDHLVTFSVHPQLNGYPLERGREFYRELEQRLWQLPGVKSVAICGFGPLSHSESMTNVTVEGYRAYSEDDAQSDANAVGPGYFRTLGTPLIAGREFDDHDRLGAAKVAIVNEAFAKHFLPGRSAIGQRMEIGAGRKLDIEIVGVVKNAQNLDLREVVKPTYFVPFDQSDERHVRNASFFIRTSSNPTALENSIRAVAHSLDQNVPAMDVETMSQKVNDSAYTDRLIAIFAIAFGALALFLAAIGLYGVIAYSVTRRTAEIGVRRALGAMPKQIVRLVMIEVALIAIPGVVIGAAGAFVLARFMQSELYGIKPWDAGVFSLAVAVMLAIAALAGIIPAKRAANIDPQIALRYE